MRRCRPKSARSRLGSDRTRRRTVLRSNKSRFRARSGKKRVEKRQKRRSLAQKLFNDMVDEEELLKTRLQERVVTFRGEAMATLAELGLEPDLVRRKNEEKEPVLHFFVAAARKLARSRRNGRSASNAT